MKKLSRRNWFVRTASLWLLALTLECSLTPIGVNAQSPTVSANSRAIVPAPKPPATLAELRSRIDEIVHQPALDPGFFAVKIGSLDTGQTIYEQNANKFVRPASNMKLYTVATAFDRLTPDCHFVTSVYAKERPEDGKVNGDLIIYGRGDPSIAARFNNGDYFKGISDLADRIVAAGVKRVKGDLVGDESYFNGSPVGSGWEWEDLTWSYGAQISALTINDNAIDLNIKPGTTVGAPVTIVTGPPNASFISVVNRATTSPKGLKSGLQIYRGLGANALEISSLQSPPFAVIAAQTLKPSQNQYTELILRTLGTMQPGPTEDSARTTDDETAGLEGVKNFLRRAGIGENDVALNDGSGLSRNDLISANTTVQL